MAFMMRDNPSPVDSLDELAYSSEANAQRKRGFFLSLHPLTGIVEYRSHENVRSEVGGSANDSIQWQLRLSSG